MIAAWRREVRTVGAGGGEQQDLDQGAGATGVTVRGAGRGPERLVLDRDRP
ncbi:hypothetical protein [Saccharothrix longispora]|uniref:hypothetical protein n=1 Tax=Saccharothrix longispora TaxID=33920 RepID=UPI0028FD6026|nr:hypothetical protein [Saccharothrix longispora]MBY8851787.1 hypothetical protein [Saccharothrix sp. MB29]MDU0287911.1 hypothetical protein [Saccharothrix longispora]